MEFTLYVYPELIEEREEISCVWRSVGFGWRMIRGGFPQRRGSQSADRAGARRFGRLSRDAARQRAGAVGRRVELSTSGRGSLVRRRHDPRLVRAVRTKRRRRPGRFDVGGSSSKMSAKQCGRFEGLGWARPCRVRRVRSAPGSQGIRPRLRKPLGADRAAASPGARISQAGSHLAQARRRSKRRSSRATKTS